jgi:hypothetical protein
MPFNQKVRANKWQQERILVIEYLKQDIEEAESL